MTEPRLLIIHESLEKAEKYCQDTGLIFTKRFRALGDGNVRIGCWGAPLAGTMFTKMVGIADIEDHHYKQRKIEWWNMMTHTRMYPGKGVAELYWINREGKVVKTESYRN